MNIIGVNSINLDPGILGVFKKVNYRHMEIEFDPLSPSKEEELMSELQATGFVIDAEVVKTEGFQGKNGNTLLLMLVFILFPD